MRILVVEDELSALCLFVCMLVAGGFEVSRACNGAEALEISRGYDGVIDLLLADIMMPGMTGIELAERVSVERPAMKVMLMSGYNQGWAINPHWSFLAKPFSCDTLISSINQAFAA